MKESMHTPWHKLIHRVVIPFSVLTTSTFLLYGSYQIYHTRQQAKLTSGLTSFALSDSLLGSQIGVVRVSGHAMNPANAASHDALGSSSSANPTNHSTAPATGIKTTPSTFTPVTLDVGFAPVSGGQVQGTTPPTTATSVPQSVVAQFGEHPQTDFTPSALTTPMGDVLHLPSGMDTSRLLALPLSKGILWAVVPPEAILANGLMGMAVEPTSIQYTRYQSVSGATQNLTDNTLLLGRLPSLASSPTPSATTDWYNPVEPVTHNNLIDNGSAVSNGLANTSSTDSSPVSSAPSVQPPTQPTLYLRGFYQTSVGAVLMILEQQPNGEQSNLVYLWDEAHMTLKLVCALPNHGGTYSWVAIGYHLIYWETRRLTTTGEQHYVGEDNVYNVQTGLQTRIAFGSWASQATAIGDSLVFQVRNTTTWERFVPNRTILAPGK